MLILAVDTTTQAGSVAVLNDERLLGVISTCVGETYSSRIFRQLEFLLHELSLKTEQFDLFAVAAGPGSFSGLRVGLAATKAWAEVHHKPIAAVSALEAVAAQVPDVFSSQEGGCGGPFLAAMIDARRGQVYAAVYRPISKDSSSTNELIRQGVERVMEAPEFLAALRVQVGDASVIFTTPTPDILSGALAASSFSDSQVLTASPVLAPVIGLLGLAHARQGKLVDALHLEANYVRRSDAELVFKALRT